MAGVGVADEIGWGAETPRRTHRARWVAVWLVAVVAVVGSLLVPLVRGSLADSAARRLAESWAAYGDLDGRRFVLVKHVAEQAGLNDDALVADAAHAGDRVEIRALTELRGHVAAGHAWADDVAAARRAVLATFAAETSALQADLASAEPSTGFVYGDDTLELAKRADELVTAVVRDHHVDHVRPVQVAMPPLAASLQQVSGLTNADTGLHLVVRDDQAIRDYDLDTGRRISVVSGRGVAGIALAGSTLLLTHGRHIVALAATGSTTTLPTPRYAGVLGATSTGWWLLGGKQVRRFDSRAHPVTPWVDLPEDGAWYPIAATVDSLVLIRYQGESTPTGAYDPDVTLLAQWWPATGRMTPLLRDCTSPDATAAANVVLVFGCHRGDRITLYDGGSGARLSSVRQPNRRGSRLLSPDGRTLVIARGRAPATIELLDLRTGTVTRVRAPAAVSPVAWSSDSHWLLVARNASDGTTSTDNLALLDTHTKQLFSVRLRYNPERETVVGLR